MKKIVWIFILFFCGGEVFALPAFPRAEIPQKKFLVGEKLVYGIRYLGIPVGVAEAEVKEIVVMDQKQVYHVQVRVSSYPVIDLIYKVEDEHHSYFEVESLKPVRYEKKMRQGRHESSLIMSFDHHLGKVKYFYPRTNKEKIFDFSEQARDQLSAGYWFRTIPLDEQKIYKNRVHADEKEWDMSIETFKMQSMKIDHIGRFEALEAKPQIDFVGMFVKKGAIRGWISLDERRIPLKMKARVPVLGSVVAELKEYRPGT